MRKPPRAPVCRRGRVADDGFSLVEAVIAVFIAAVVFSSAALLMMSMTISTLTARQNQQAIDLISETVEEFRKQDYAALAMVPSDLAADVTTGVVRQSGTQYFFDPENDTTGAGAGEEIITSATGALNPHRNVVRRNATRFTVATFVTDPADATGDYKRVTVRVSWQIRAKVHDRQVTTFITETRRGLPLPDFVLAADSSRTVTAGATDEEFKVKLTNRGARDQWNLSMTPSGGGWTNVRWYEDSDHDGVLDRDATTAITEPLISQTDVLETDDVYDFFLVVDHDGVTLGGVDLVITATSIAQPGAESASASVTKSVLTTAPVCAPCAQFARLYLDDGSGALSLSSNPPDGTDVDRAADAETAVRGASIAAGGSMSWTSPGAPALMSLDGTSTVTLYAATENFDRNLRGQLRVDIYNATSGVLLGSATEPQPNNSGQVPRWNSTDFKEITFAIPITTTLATGQQLRVTVSPSNGVGMILQYDVVSSHEANVTFPVVS